MAERDWLFVNCQYGGQHQWQFSGGRNASCELGNSCYCSVPVNECAVCGECDYGENDEAAQMIAECRSTGLVNMRGMPHG